jgi:hypothetical protein
MFEKAQHFQVNLFQFQNISAGVVSDPVNGGPRYLQQPAQVEIKTKG